MKIMIAGGGTGGHFYPALAIAEEFARQGHEETVFFGRRNSFESRKFAEMKLPHHLLDIQGIIRSFTWRNLLFMPRLLRSFLQTRKAMKAFQPDVVIGTGGYVSGMPVFVANRLSIPVYIQEQNAFPGLTTRIAGRFARQIFLGFPDDARRFDTEKSVYYGNPVRGNVGQADRSEARRLLGLSETDVAIVVIGGSQGALSINQSIATLLPQITSHKNARLFWQTGQSHFSRFELLADDYENIKISPFYDNMPDMLAAADIMVCRAGAITLAELALVGRAAILIPYPHAAENHQWYNARRYAEKDAAYMVDDAPEMQDALWLYIEQLLNKSDLREAMAARCREFGRPHAATMIVEHILKEMD
jgi:UDP-N-acetylglucosamine--N-acetylmuramyl-(pentapeptide) pyrophosphoryl-undecaprenol N-acetylglucosamine transferase